MSESQSTRLHATVVGDVQGVGFRAFVLNTAQAMNLTGWVRNTYTGNVEVVAEGSHPILERLVDVLRKGPRSAYVDNVIVEWEKATGEFREFSVTRTV